MDGKPRNFPPSSNWTGGPFANGIKDKSKRFYENLFLFVVKYLGNSHDHTIIIFKHLLDSGFLPETISTVFRDKSAL